MASASPQQLQLLDSTLTALQGGLPRITDQDREAVGSWVDALGGTETLAPVAQELRRLQDAIAQNHHGTIADSLSALSEQTGHAATTATPDVQSRLYQLSQVLKLAAGQVGR